MTAHLTRLLLCLLCCANLVAQAQAVVAPPPHLSGTLALSVEHGTLTADLLLSHVPPLADGRLWLHTGLNVESFRDSTDRLILPYIRRYSADTAEAAWQYQRVDTQGKPVPWPRAFRVRYTGAYPVQADSSRLVVRGDYKGSLAFNGLTVRGTEQTAWYPVLYDRAHDQQVAAYTYELQVACPDCQTLYLTGSDPVPGPTQRLSSATPVPLVLFAGKYTTQRLGTDWLLNSKLTPGQATTFSHFVAGIRQYYAQQLRLPYRQALTFLYTTPISKRNGWLFVTFPTVASVGWNTDFSLLFRGTGETLADSTLLPFLSHEFGHYYFGELLRPNAELRWFFLEGTTEYMGLKAVEHRLSLKLYRKRLAGYRQALLKADDLPGLQTIKQSEELSQTYRYVVVPLQLLALERQVGEK